MAKYKKGDKFVVTFEVIKLMPKGHEGKPIYILEKEGDVFRISLAEFQLDEIGREKRGFFREIWRRFF